MDKNASAAKSIDLGHAHFMQWRWLLEALYIVSGLF